MRSAPAAGRTQAGDDVDTSTRLEQENEVEEKKLELRLLMLLKDFDDKLLQEAIKIISA